MAHTPAASPARVRGPLIAGKVKRNMDEQLP
jgi:hypothetical protein